MLLVASFIHFICLFCMLTSFEFTRFYFVLNFSCCLFSLFFIFLLFATYYSHVLKVVKFYTVLVYSGICHFSRTHFYLNLMICSMSILFEIEVIFFENVFLSLSFLNCSIYFNLMNFILSGDLSFISILSY